MAASLSRRIKIAPIGTPSPQQWRDKNCTRAGSSSTELSWKFPVSVASSHWVWDVNRLPIDHGSAHRQAATNGLQGRRRAWDHIRATHRKRLPLGQLTLDRSQTSRRITQPRWHFFHDHDPIPAERQSVNWQSRAGLHLSRSAAPTPR